MLFYPIVFYCILLHYSYRTRLYSRNVSDCTSFCFYFKICCIMPHYALLHHVTLQKGQSWGLGFLHSTLSHSFRSYLIWYCDILPFLVCGMVSCSSIMYSYCSSSILVSSNLLYCLEVYYTIYCAALYYITLRREN